MRQAIVCVLASAVLTAAVTSAHVFAPPPDGTPPRPTIQAPLSAAPAKSGFEARQAPVPLLVRERPVRGAAVVAEASVMGAAASPTVVNEEGRHFARSAVQADGYKDVRDISAAPDGTWRARAMRGRTEVVITVDREGRVSAN